jgi:DNA-binding SARP family transcriptional activator
VTSDEEVVNFGILGPLEIHPDQGLPAGRVAQLLAALLLRAGDTVPLSRLVDMLWDGREPRSHLANLQTYASRLRRMLPGVPVDWHQGGYRIGVDPGQVDAHVFVRLAKTGQNAATPDERASHYRSALALWRGAPLSGIAAGPFEPDLTRLAELRLSMLEGLTDADLAAGRLTEAIARLDDLVHEHPWQESLWAQLVTALISANRVDEALDTFHQASRVLRDELGAGPGELLLRSIQSLPR